MKTDLPAAPDPMAVLDPEIAEFVRRSNAASAALPRRDLLPESEARRVAVEARRQWFEGGPEMASSEDRMIATRHGEIRIRIHRPNDCAARGVFVYLHGGGWVLFSLETHDRLMREYADAGKMVVIGADYSLAPEAKFPQAIEEIDDLLDWVREYAQELGVDPDRIALGGDSAGGNLTAATCILRRDLGKWLPAAMVLNYGGYDMGMFKESVAKYGQGDYLLTSHSMVWFTWRYIRGPEDVTDPLASPLRADHTGLPPAFMCISEVDTLHDDNIAMAASLKAAGVEVKDVIYPGTVHSFLEGTSICAVARRAVADTAEWLAGKIA